MDRPLSLFCNHRNRLVPRSPRLLLVTLTLLVLALVVGGFFLGYRALTLEARDTRRLSAQLDVSELVLEAKFYAAAVSRAQVAYAFDAHRRGAAAWRDGAKARTEFARASTMLRQKLTELGQARMTEAQRQALSSARASFDRFVAFDETVLTAYRSGEDARALKADARVLDEGTPLYNALTRSFDALALALRAGSDSAGERMTELNRNVRHWLSALALLSIGLSAFLVWMVARTLAKRDALAAQLDTLARTDALTGVANRRAWDEELPRALERSKRTGLPLCVVLVDLDHFKKFNDEHGHQAGDRLLSDMSAAFTAELRKDDQLARYGGEEFALLLNGCDAAQARATLERLSKVMPQRQTFSAGIVQCDGSEDARAVVALADRALYQAKSTGRRRAVVADKSALGAPLTPDSNSDVAPNMRPGART
jgi:diguanylate cyclase (GGDEF)-like protein